MNQLRARGARGIEPSGARTRHDRTTSSVGVWRVTAAAYYDPVCTRPMSSGDRCDREDDDVADGTDGMSAGPGSGLVTEQYWDRLVSVAAGDDRRRRALERSRLFDQDAERYDRCRPRYPDAVIDELLAPSIWSRGARRGLWHRDHGTADG